MTNESDYPADHSMDTLWFAVDPEGNVAVFNTGESGAVPTEAYLGEDGFAVLEEVRDTGHRSEPILDVTALGGRHSSAPSEDQTVPTLLLLESAGQAERVLTRSKGRRVRTTNGVGVIIDELGSELHRELHDAGSCLGCEWHFEDEEPDPASFGLYRYEHSTDNWISGPYELAARPDQPLSSGALPASASLHAVRVEQRFADSPRINPAERFACESWEPGWLHSDGKTVRAFPGREHELEELAAELGEEFVIERGAASSPAAKSGATADGPGGQFRRRPWWKFW